MRKPWALIDAEIFKTRINFAGGSPSDPKFLREWPADCYATLETKLFAHPIGWCDMKIVVGHPFFSTTSVRLRSWWRDFALQGYDPNSLP